MAMFGRYEFGKVEPTEVYEGDYMTLEKGYVSILKGERGLVSFQSPDLVTVIYLGQGQSVREIKTDAKSLPKQKTAGRKFR